MLLSWVGYDAAAEDKLDKVNFSRLSVSPNLLSRPCPTDEKEGKGANFGEIDLLFSSLIELSTSYRASCQLLTNNLTSLVQIGLVLADRGITSSLPWGVINIAASNTLVAVQVLLWSL